jgi:hypothetical protein
MALTSTSPRAFDELRDIMNSIAIMRHDGVHQTQPSYS